MPCLPHDLLAYIVEAVYHPKTQWVLLTISRETSRFALTAVYRELSFDSRDAPSSYVARDPKYMISLEKLSLSDETNPHLRFTSSLNFFSYTSSDLGNNYLAPSPDGETHASHSGKHELLVVICGLRGITYKPISILGIPVQGTP
ncbi:hypothetical protein BDN71DRAFT_745619 [Pleurotus eryngii]|uniref:Uncharacterized protein n=1 Tax=Pleurotus eryngii TaxID=5323 RepID=A0A9P5ZGI6_PLEER|nr:hypothetical protein BDN71DRAFT_745619 [Pleurotus eryngii]